MENILKSAISNNAHWCELVCNAQSKKGNTTETIWYNQKQVPMFYPNLVTLNKHLNDDDNLVVKQLINNPPKDNWAIKDSYANLDLTALGFFELFESNWFDCPFNSSLFNSKNPSNLSDISIETIKDSNNLSNWELSWSKHQPMTPEPPIFSESLLKNKDIVFLAIKENNIITKGLIANFSNDVIGISNVFGFEIFDQTIMNAFQKALWSAFGEYHLVGYEALEDINKASDQGFKDIGALKVWMKE